MVTKLIKELTPNKRVITELTEMSHVNLLENNI
jgi:hypothetical protein